MSSNTIFILLIIAAALGIGIWMGIAIAGVE